MSLDALIARLSEDSAADLAGLIAGVTEADALKVQLAVKHRQAERGDPIVGHQASLTSTGSRQAFPDGPDPLVGTFLASMLRPSGCVLPAGGPRLLAELEVAVLLRGSLEGPEVTEADATAAIEAYAPAIELVALMGGLAGTTPHWPEAIARQKLGGYVVVGAPVPAARFDPAAEVCRLSFDGAAAGEGAVSGLTRTPAGVVAAIARQLAEAGGSLRAGETVITGSVTPPAAVRPGVRRIAGAFTILGAVEAEIAAG